MVVPDDAWDGAFDAQLAPVRAWFDSGDRDPNDFDQHGFTLLYRTFQGSEDNAPRLAVVQFLLERGADVNVPQRGRSSWATISCFHLVCQQWNDNPVDLLLRHGADANQIGDGMTPLEWAFEYYSGCMFEFFYLFNVSVLTLMLRAGASIDFARLPPEVYLRRMIEGDRPYELASQLREGFEDGESDFDDLYVDERVREINEGIDLSAGVRQDGSYRAYLRRPHKALLRIRSLRAHGRAHAVATPPHIVARLLDPAFPREIAWDVLKYWRDAG